MAKRNDWMHLDFLWLILAAWIIPIPVMVLIQQLFQRSGLLGYWLGISLSLATMVFGLQRSIVRQYSAPAVLIWFSWGLATLLFSRIVLITFFILVILMW